MALLFWFLSPDANRAVGSETASGCLRLAGELPTVHLLSGPIIALDTELQRSLLSVPLRSSAAGGDQRQDDQKTEDGKMQAHGC